MIRRLALLVLIAAPLVAQTTPAAPKTLREQMPFKVGVAIGPRQILEKDTRGVALIDQQFNSITPENALKWGPVHPEPDRYDFRLGDAFVDFGTKRHMFVIGHTLVWHNQTPDWVFLDREKPATCDLLLTRMRDHIKTVVGRYKRRIAGWDVVNEAINRDGSMRKSRWYEICGDRYIPEAFKAAHEADPAAELYYNDFSLEFPEKRKGAVKLMKKLLAEGVPISAIGLQNHDLIDWPSAEQEEETIKAFTALGLRVNITELDIDVLPRPQGPEGDAEVTNIAPSDPKYNPYPNGAPAEVLKKQAQRYAEFFAVFRRQNGGVERVTFWGLTDADSWLNTWPIRGRTNYPLLWDRDGNPKPAYDAVMNGKK